MTAATRAAGAERVFPLRPPPRGTRLRTYAVLAAVLVPVTLLASLGDARVLPALLLPWAITIGLLEFFVRRAVRGRIVMSDAGLRLEAPLATDAIRWGAIRADEARIVDLGAERELRPRWRQMGLGLQGYRSGMFQLRDGSSALLAMADGASVVLVPWGQRSRLLLTPEDPEAFLAELRARAG